MMISDGFVEHSILSRVRAALDGADVELAGLLWITGVGCLGRKSSPRRILG
jgi:hypothetical protein